jgi:hypothetical protein
VIVGALVKQLDAKMDVTNAEPGLRIVVSRSTARSRLPSAA